MTDHPQEPADRVEPLSEAAPKNPKPTGPTAHLETAEYWSEQYMTLLEVGNEVVAERDALTAELATTRQRLQQLEEFGITDLYLQRDEARFLLSKAESELATTRQELAELEEEATEGRYALDLYRLSETELRNKFEVTRQERDALSAKVQTVLANHWETPDNDGDASGICTCGEEWPCSTYAALAEIERLKGGTDG